MKPSPRPSLPTALALGVLLLPILACGGSRPSGDHAGTGNWVLRITPGDAATAIGQTLQFQAATPWGGEAQWSVVPATAGTITPGGLFTASANLGTYTVLAVWSKDVRYTASARVTVLPAPPPAVSTPGLVQAFGAQQTGGSFTNSAVGGEPVPAVTSTSLSQTFQVRHGYLPGASPSH